MADVRLVEQYRASILLQVSKSLSLVLDLDLILLFDSTSRAAGAHLLELGVIWTVKIVVVLDGILVSLLELGLEEVVTSGHGRGVGATLWLVGEVVWEVFELGVAWSAPACQSTSIGARMECYEVIRKNDVR